MKKYIIIAIVMAFASGAFAATVTPAVKGQARFEQGPGILVSSWHMADAIITNARNDTIVFTRDIDPYFNHTSRVSFAGTFRTNNTGADSGDISIKLEVGWDSAHYFIPLADTVTHRQVGLAADTFTVGQQGVYRYYDGYYYNRILNDSTLTYPLYTIQPKSVSTGYPLLLPLELPRDHYGNLVPLTRFRLVCIKGAKFKANDTTWIKNAAIITEDLFK